MDEYESDKLAEDSADEKRIKKAQEKAYTKCSFLFEFQFFGTETRQFAFSNIGYRIIFGNQLS